MKKVLFASVVVVFGLCLFSGIASAQVAVPCASLQQVSDLTPGEHQVDGGKLVVNQDVSEVTLSPTNGGSLCRFEALNADGTTPSDGSFDGNHYVQTGHIDVIEFAFMPTAGGSSDTTTNTPVVIGAGAFVVISVLGLAMASKHVASS